MDNAGFDTLVRVFEEKLHARRDAGAKEFAEAALAMAASPEPETKLSGTKRGLSAMHLWKRIPQSTPPQHEDGFPKTKGYLFRIMLVGYLWAEPGSLSAKDLSEVILDQGIRTEKEMQAISQAFASELKEWNPEIVIKRLSQILASAQPRPGGPQDVLHMIGRSLAHFVSENALVEFGKLVLALPPEKRL